MHCQTNLRNRFWRLTVWRAFSQVQTRNIFVWGEVQFYIRTATETRKLTRISSSTIEPSDLLIKLILHQVWWKNTLLHDQIVLSNEAFKLYCSIGLTIKWAFYNVSFIQFDQKLWWIVFFIRISLLPISLSKNQTQITVYKHV